MLLSSYSLPPQQRHNINHTLKAFQVQYVGQLRQISFTFAASPNVITLPREENSFHSCTLAFCFRTDFDIDEDKKH